MLLPLFFLILGVASAVPVTLYDADAHCSGQGRVISTTDNCTLFSCEGDARANSFARSSVDDAVSFYDSYDCTGAPFFSSLAGFCFFCPSTNRSFFFSSKYVPPVLSSTQPVCHFYTSATSQAFDCDANMMKNDECRPNVVSLEEGFRAYVPSLGQSFRIGTFRTWYAQRGFASLVIPSIALFDPNSASLSGYKSTNFFRTQGLPFDSKVQNTLVSIETSPNLHVKVCVSAITDHVFLFGCCDAGISGGTCGIQSGILIYSVKVYSGNECNQLGPRWQFDLSLYYGMGGLEYSVTSCTNGLSDKNYGLIGMDTGVSDPSPFETYYSVTCSATPNDDSNSSLAIPIGISVVGISLVFIFIFVLYRRRRNSAKTSPDSYVSLESN